MTIKCLLVELAKLSDSRGPAAVKIRRNSGGSIETQICNVKRKLRLKY